MTCPRCKGTKALLINRIINGKKEPGAEAWPCPTCHATGEASKEEVKTYKTQLNSMKLCWCQCPKSEQEGTHQTEVMYKGRMTRMWICRKCGKPMPDYVRQFYW